MRVSTLLVIGAAVCVVAQSARPGAGQRIATATRSGANTGESKDKFTFFLFWKENDAATQKLTDDLRRAVAERSSRAEWTAVNIRDPANRAIVDRYQVHRVPTPLVLAVAPNGAITGAFPRQLSAKAVDYALVTPAMAAATKALQDKKIVLVHVKADPRTPLPAGAVDLMADPTFQARTTSVDVLLGDTQESRFLSDMKIDAASVTGSLLVVFAPPGADVGKFPATATKDQLAAALHAAGKCCDDPNCKHNKKGQ